MRRSETGFEVEISSLLVNDVVKAMRKHGFEEDAKILADAEASFGARTVSLVVGDWTTALLRDVIPLMVNERRASSYLKAMLEIRSNPTTGAVKRLNLLPKAMAAYLAEDAIDGWIYREVPDEGVYVAYVVRSLQYHSEDTYHHNPEYVSMEIEANLAEFSQEGERHRRNDGLSEPTVTFGRDSLVGGKATAAKILMKAGYLKETQELKEAYTKELERFNKLRPRYGKQMLARTIATDISGTWWDRSDHVTSMPHPVRMVNEEEILNRKVKVECGNYYFYDHGIKEGNPKFARVPLHPYLLMFDLVRHKHCWVHTNNLRPYKYDHSLREKLVLPETHRGLVDILTQDIDVFSEDIIAGKSGGTALLCYGAPGLGKTLTAEVYSELTEKPLYRVDAGQLGTDVETVERELVTILRRAERWKAVLLLDEADVYIRKRGNDLHHNAVVACFLRTLEYFHGLLFLTTNRINDVDDAIQSRMVAMFKYEPPGPDDSSRIWTVLSTQFGIDIGPALREELIKAFPGISGRDIKQLLKLTAKYAKFKKIKLSLDAFRVCAMFRGIV